MSGPLDEGERSRRQRLVRLLGGPDTEWLVARVRRRMSTATALTGTISLAKPTAAQRKAIEVLLGRRPGTGASIGISLTDLDAHLRRCGLHPDGLPGAIEELAGPVPDQAAERAALAAAWAEALRPLEELRDTAGLAAWAADPGTTGLVRRLAGGSSQVAADLVTGLVAVLTALPAAGVPLAQFAAGVTGDPHALDRGRPLATLALSAIRGGWAASWAGEDLDEEAPAQEAPAQEASTQEDPAQEASTQEAPAQRRRRMWDTVGVLVDELSSTVLVLNLPLGGDGPLSRITGAAGAVGEPLVLTLRQLAREPVVPVAGTVFVCENPAVVAAAADRLGPTCPPLVCVGGQPATAALRLLDAVARVPAEIRYHGDFDWGGLRIANLLYQRVPIRPWRFDSTAYTAAIDAACGGRLGGPLAGAPVAARWDCDLHRVMASVGQRVAEELVLAELLDDLAGHSRR